MRKKKVVSTKTVSTPSGEEKAFVYQQAMELSPLLGDNGPIAVILEKNKTDKKNIKYSVTFILVPDSLNIKIQSEGDNLFDVCINAKQKAKKTLRQILNQMPSPVRRLKMAHFKKYPYSQ